MNLIRTQWAFENRPDGEAMLRLIEAAGRNCYKSECKITPDSAAPFVRKLTHQLKHHSVLEHANQTVRVICDRGISHEIVRHRIGAYSQESTRYCRYKDDQVTFIWPEHMDLKPEWQQDTYKAMLIQCEANYAHLLGVGWTPQEARGILPNELKTEIVITYNLRQWRHFFQMRCAKGAHPQMRVLAKSMLAGFQKAIPVVFEDLA